MQGSADAARKRGALEDMLWRIERDFKVIIRTLLGANSLESLTTGSGERYGCKQLQLQQLCSTGTAFLLPSGGAGARRAAKSRLADAVANDTMYAYTSASLAFRRSRPPGAPPSRGWRTRSQNAPPWRRASPARPPPTPNRRRCWWTHR